MLVQVVVSFGSKRANRDLLTRLSLISINERRTGMNCVCCAFDRVSASNTHRPDCGICRIGLTLAEARESRSDGENLRSGASPVTSCACSPAGAFHVPRVV